MQIDGVNPNNGNAWGLEKPPRTDQPTGDGEVDESSPTISQSSDTESGDTEDGDGVVSLLVDGHFNGVADVRLRINFFEELSAIEQSNLQTVAEEKINGVLESVGAGVESLLAYSQTTTDGTEDELEGLAELQEIFAGSVDEIKQDYFNAETSSTDELVINLNGAFDAFIESLWNLYTSTTETQEGGDSPPADDGGEETDTIEASGGEEITAVNDGGEETDTIEASGGEEITAVNDGSEETDVIEASGEEGSEESGEVTDPDWQSYIEQLESLFAAAMEELTNSLNESSVLPELSEPNGNGVAYDKFLAIYNELQGIATADEGSETGEIELLDLTV